MLENADWTKLGHMMALLDDDRRARIVNDVNELLFLWMAAIDESAGDSPQLNAKSGPNDEDLLAPALAICQKALVWVEPKAPWRALEARLRASRRSAAGSQGNGRRPAESTRFNEPREVNEVDSPLDCFQWGVLAYRARPAVAGDRVARASEPARGGKNYWYQFLLGYLEDKAGRTDDAFSNYNIACALRPDRPGSSSAGHRIYRVPRPVGPGLAKTSAVRLETTERQARGDARCVSSWRISTSKWATSRGAEGVRPRDRGPTARASYGRAARLNRANMDGRVGGRRKGSTEYDALILEDLTDTTARKSRALLELRLGQADRAAHRLDRLFSRRRSSVKNRHEVLAARALGVLASGPGGRGGGRCDGMRSVCGRAPAHERLRQRALLAARRPESLQLDRPEDVLALPGGREASDRRLSKRPRRRWRRRFKLGLTRRCGHL